MSVCTTRPCANTVGSRLKRATASTAARVPKSSRAKRKISNPSTTVRKIIGTRGQKESESNRARLFSQKLVS